MEIQLNWMLVRPCYMRKALLSVFSSVYTQDNRDELTGGYSHLDRDFVGRLDASLRAAFCLLKQHRLNSLFDLVGTVCQLVRVVVVMGVLI